MSKKQVDFIWLGLSILFFFMLAISFLLMPFGNVTPDETISAYTLSAGLMFWLSIAMGVVTQCVLAYRRRTWYASHRSKKIRIQQKIGFVTFFSNIYATIADIVSILSLLGFVISMFATQGTGYICYVFISLLVFSFSMHCILNGKGFYHIINQDKLLQTIEKERDNSLRKERKE